MRNKSLIIRLVISSVLIIVLLYRIDINQILIVLKTASPVGLAAAFLFYLFTYVVIAARWASILYFQGHHFKFTRLFSYYLIGFFFNNFVPTGIGGDVVRCIYISKGSKAPEFFTSSVIVERILGLIATTLIAVLALPFSDFPVNIRWAVVVIGICIWALFFILISPTGNRQIKRLTSIIPGKKIKEFAGEVIHSFSLFRAISLLVGFILSLAYQVSLILYFYLVGQALHIDLSVWNYLAFLPIVWIVGLLPITINAIGVREAGFSWMFSALGEDPSLGFSNSIIGFLLAVIASLCGGILFVWKGRFKSRFYKEE